MGLLYRRVSVKCFPSSSYFPIIIQKQGTLKSLWCSCYHKEWLGMQQQMASPAGSESRAFGTISPAWAQGTASRLVAVGSYLLCWKNNQSPTFSESKTLWEFDNKVSPRYLCVPKQCICVCSQPSAPRAAWSILQAGSASCKLWNK